MRQIFGTGEESNEGAASKRAVIADRAFKDGVEIFKRVQNRGKTHHTVLRGYNQRDFSSNLGKSPQMGREFDANRGGSNSRFQTGHGSVCASTERTAGRSWTIACQESPPSGEP